ncbi:MAG: ribosome small subunit-dependent GTPase A [Muribaculaceae bacterium]|nr:ribosome small subunit-dependent GTPase A [Muribaculaceae bacterium]MDE6642535.1 ribosome small subunit-dependent GTPase A [Muribaculaceae bacterium]
MEALVIRNTGSWYVALDQVTGQEINCKIKGNFRLKGIRTTNPVAVGDVVDVTVNPDGTGFITAIHPRRNYIIRRASNLSKESHILATNLDYAVLVATLAHPTTSTTFIDRFLATAEAYRVEAILVINKIDMLIEPEDKELLDAVCYLYRSIGYKVITLSAKTGEGIEKLRDTIQGKITLFSGNSGVGKSSLINALIPGLDLKTAEISDIHDTGMHTTTFSEMFRLPGENGGWIIDTPGVRGFGTIEMTRQEVSHYFPEIFEIGHDCRYGDCTHTGEPGCAVQKALEENLIAQSRFNSYLSILDDIEPDKYRKGY